MNSKKKIEKYKRFYENGFWTRKMVAALVYDGKLTPEEYEEITGRDLHRGRRVSYNAATSGSCRDGRGD